MNTLTDLKRLLDQGETLVKNGESLLRLSENIYELRYGPENWARGGWDFIAECVGDPSLWHQRDQIGAEKPVMMEVPVEQKFEQRALDAEYLLDVYKGAYKDVGGLEMDDDFILSLRDKKK